VLCLRYSSAAQRPEAALHKNSNLGECRAISTVPGAKRPDGTLDITPKILMVGSLSVPSGRFARGTVLLACYFLCKAQPSHYLTGVSCTGPVGTLTRLVTKKTLIHTSVHG
jgi:hypothetical protein